MTLPVSQAGARLVDSNEPRLQRLVEEQLGFVWRLLRRVGVQAVEADDAAKQVFSAVARRLTDIRAGSERAFLLSTALHVAARVRRERAQAADIASHAEHDSESAASVAPEEGLDQRACALVDELLAEMPLELRVVFALYEIEQLDRTEISEIVGVPFATVTTRLHGAREDFRARVAKLEGTEGTPGDSNDDDSDEKATRLSESGSELVRVLLIAAREEQPNDSATTQALATAKPVSIPKAISSVPPSAKARALVRAVATSSNPPVSVARRAPASTGALIAKWLLIGLVIGAALSVAGFGLSGAFTSAPQQQPVPR